MTVPLSPSPELRIGAHTSIAGGLARALERGAALGCDVIQLFTSSGRQWRRRDLSADEVDAWQRTRVATGVMPAMAHASYLINLAATRRDLRERSRRALAAEYRRCGRLAIPYLVFHPGAHMGTGVDRGIARIAAALDRILGADPDNPTLLVIENTAGQGSAIGHRFGELGQLLARSRHPDRLGVCLDTCHAFAAGYDLRGDAGWDRTLSALLAEVGADRLRALHVNDSKAELGARVDRHEHLGRGHIGLPALRALVNDPRVRGLPMVIETPKPVDRADPVNLGILRALDGRVRVGQRARRLVAEPLAAEPARVSQRGRRRTRR